MNYPHRTSDLPDSKVLATIGNRPLVVQVGFLILSFALIFFTRVWYIGGFFLLLSLASIAVTKDYLTCQVYQDQLAIFNRDNPEELRLVKFEDILSYQMDQKGMAGVMLTVRNPLDEEIPEQLGISTFQAGKLQRKLRKLLPQQDAYQQQINSFQQETSRKKAQKKETIVTEAKKKKVL